MREDFNALTACDLVRAVGQCDVGAPAAGDLQFHVAAGNHPLWRGACGGAAARDDDEHECVKGPVPVHPADEKSSADKGRRLELGHCTGAEILEKNELSRKRRAVLLEPLT